MEENKRRKKGEKEEKMEEIRGEEKGRRRKKNISRNGKQGRIRRGEREMEEE